MLGTLRIFGLKNCDSCRKATKSLADAYLIDIREDPLADDLLDQALAQFGEDLVNRRSTTWRGLSETERAVPPRDLLRAHAALMKRPLIQTGDGTLYLGWSADVRAALGVE